MKKRILFMMVPALLFSWAGWAQNLDLFSKLESGDYDFEIVDDADLGIGGYTLAKDGDEWVFTLGNKNTMPNGATGEYEAGYAPFWIHFDEGEIAEGGYTAVSIQVINENTHIYGSNSVGMVVKVNGEWIEDSQDGDVADDHKYYLKEEYIADGIQAIGIFGLWFNAPGQVIRIKKLELIKETPPYPKFFVSPITFDNPELILNDYQIPVQMSTASFTTAAGDNGWPSSDGWSATFVQDEEQGVVMKIKGRSVGEGYTNPISTGQVCMFKTQLPEGKTFGDIKEISFKYKFESDPPEGESWYGVNYIVFAAKTGLKPDGEYYSDGTRHFDLYPAVYYSFEEEGAFDEGYGAWATLSMQTKWFDKEEGLFDNARFQVGDNYVPDLESINGENEIWLGVGINTWGYYYMDDITLHFGGNSVESVKIVPAMKVYSIQGGLAIEGAEKAAIYGIDGTLIATAKGQIALPKGIYIVKAGSEVVKAIVK